MDIKWTPPYKTKPIYHVSKSGKKYEWDKYCDEGHIGRSMEALPEEDFPYTIEYEDPQKYKPVWL